MVKKVWLPVKGWEDRYAVSNYGEVWSHVTSRVLRPGRTAAGYLTVNLCRNGVSRSHYIHTLVAVAFIPNPERKRTVNHKQLPTTNNRVTNLEWATHGENHKHAYAVLGRKCNPRWGAENSRSRPVANCQGEKFECIRGAAKAYGVTGASIAQAIRRRGRSAGVKWRFIRHA